MKLRHLVEENEQFVKRIWIIWLKKMDRLVENIYDPQILSLEHIKMVSMSPFFECPWMSENFQISSFKK